MRKSFTNSIGVCCSMILIFLLTTNLNAQYCTSSSTGGTFEWLTNVTFAGINNSSGPSGYSDFTTISGSVIPGASYEFSGTIAQEVFIGDSEYLQIWIDWNQDEIFSAEERTQIGTVCNSNNCTLTDMVDVPEDAVPGETRMRVIQSWNVISTDPCVSGPSGFDGETEDYAIIVLSGECTPPNFTYTVTNDCEADNYDVTALLTDFGTNTFITVYLTRSDGVPVNPVTLVVAIEGQTVAILNNIPFGVTVSASIEGQNPLCNLTRNFAELICPAENDEACTAIELICGDVLSNQVFLGATQSIDDDCSGAGTGDVWFTFTADGTQTYNIAETETDVVVDLWEGDACGALTQIQACSDFQENFLVTDAGTYYFRIRPWGTTTTYGVSLTCTPFDCTGIGNYGDPCDDGDAGTVNDVINTDCDCVGEPVTVNDEACTATLLECGDALFNQSFTGATPSVDDACSGIGVRDVWFTFVADGTQTYFIAETQTDVVVDLWSGNDCENLTSESDCMDFDENFTITEAGTYYFRIRPWGTATTYGVSLTCTPFECPDLSANIGDPCNDGNPGTVNDVISQDCECAGVVPPANDECDEALPLICGNTYTGSTQGAVFHSGLPAEFCGTDLPNADNGGVWYTITPTNDTDIDLNLAGSDYDTKLFIFAGTCEGLTCVAGNDDGGGNLTSRIETTLSGGTTYYVYVSGYASSRGNYSLSVSCIDLVCSPTIESVLLVDSEGDELDCAIIGEDYYLEVTLDGGTQASYNVSAGDSPITVINANGSGLVGPLTAINVTISAIGTTNPNCGANQAFVPSICAPTNDIPCDAIAAMNDGSVTYGSNIGATADINEVVPPVGGCNTDSTWCEGGLDNSVWFTFVGPASGRVRINGCNDASTFDSQFAIYTATDCNDYSTFDLIGANDDAPFAMFGTCASGSFRAGVELCIEPGETYYLQVDGYTAAEGTFGITIEGVDAAACDCEAPVIPAEFIFANTIPYCEEGNVGYTLAFFSPENIGSSEFFVYSYSYIPGDTTTINVPAGGSFEATDVVPLSVVTYIEINLSDENCALANTGFPISGLVAQGEFACDPDCEGVPGGSVLPGNPCDDGDPMTVNDVISEDCECIGVPMATNDEPCIATELECGVPVVQTTAGASQSLSPITCEGWTAAQAYDVWFSFTADGTSEYTITESHFDDLVLEVFSSNGCGDLTSIACGDIPETINLGALATGVYYVRAYAFSAFLPAYNINIQLDCVNNNPVTLNGTVTWNSNCDDRAGTVTLYEPNTATVVETYNITVATDGTFTVEDLPTGTYDIIVKVQGYLAKGFQDVEIAAGSNDLAAGTIRNGNVNNDNAVNFTDFSLINAAFNKSVGHPSYNPLADLNCDGSVNFLDFSILNTSINQTGAIAPL